MSPVYSRTTALSSLLLGPAPCSQLRCQPPLCSSMSNEVPIEEGLLEDLGQHIEEELHNAGFMGHPQPIHQVQDDSGGPSSSPKNYAELQAANFGADVEYPPDVEDPPATSEPYEDLERDVFGVGPAAELAQRIYEEPSEEQSQENSSATLVESNGYV